MVKSTIEGIEQSVNIEDIPTENLKKIVEHMDKTIENIKKEKEEILLVLKSREENDR